MCWCWSEKPQHRPDFQEILGVLRTDTFTHLLADTPVSKISDDVTAACIRKTKAAPRKRSSSSYQAKTCSSVQESLSLNSLLGSGATSLLHSTTMGEETVVEVWYGTQDGSLGLVQYQQSGTVTEVWSAFHSK